PKEVRNDAEQCKQNRSRDPHHGRRNFKAGERANRAFGSGRRSGIGYKNQTAGQTKDPTEPVRDCCRWCSRIFATHLCCCLCSAHVRPAQWKRAESIAQSQAMASLGDKSLLPITDSGRPVPKESHDGYLNEQDLERSATKRTPTRT